MTFLKFLASLLMLVMSVTFVYTLISSGSVSSFSPFKYQDTLIVCILNMIGYSIMSFYYLKKHINICNIKEWGTIN